MNFDEKNRDLIHRRYLWLWQDSDQFTEGEKKFLEYHFSVTDTFTTKLFELIKCAEDSELAKLEKGFLEEVNAWMNWTKGSLRERCKAVVAYEICKRAIPLP